MAVGVDLDLDTAGAKTGPKFQDQIIGSYPAYVAEPSGEEIKTGKALIYLTDNAGIWQNSRLLADDFASWGYLTVICFNSGVVRVEGASKTECERVTLTEEGTIDAIEAVLQYLINERQINSIGAIGYSAGAPWVLALLAAGAADAGFVAHPTHISAAMLKRIRAPLSVASADEDELDMDRELVAPSVGNGSTDSLVDDSRPNHSIKDLEVVLNGLEYPYQICLYNDVHQGFAVRRTVITKAELWARDKAFLQAVGWMDEFLA